MESVIALPAFCRSSPAWTASVEVPGVRGAAVADGEPFFEGVMSIGSSLSKSVESRGCLKVQTRAWAKALDPPDRASKQESQRTNDGSLAVLGCKRPQIT